MAKRGNPNLIPGVSGNPAGRPKGSKTIAQDIIFKVFEEYGKEEFEKKMIEEVKNDPVKYYTERIKPIQPDLTKDDENPDKDIPRKIIIESVEIKGLKLSNGTIQELVGLDNRG